MEHAEALESIELAAVEPEGLERLMAGDTAESGAVAGHLVGCPACAGELGRIRTTAALARQVIATTPDPALRGRTLAFVRELGRDRAGEMAAVVPASPPASAGRRPWLRWGALAAALVLAAGLGFGAAGMRSQEAELGYQLSVLEATADTTMRLGSLPDTRRVVLAGTGPGAGATGSLLFSPSSGELVVVAEGLAPLAEGEEYGCWVQVDGAKTRIGRMYPGGELQAWAGRVETLAMLPADATFGVSLVPGDGRAAEPVLTGGG